jgi:hypothetical protein
MTPFEHRVSVATMLDWRPRWSVMASVVPTLNVSPSTVFIGMLNGTLALRTNSGNTWYVSTLFSNCVFASNWSLVTPNSFNKDANAALWARKRCKGRGH